ncbi:hypothetical protein MLD38_026320 [Melastoma candidum]|uniref:Uncharacterized protein n=1 Tax=Melastoma candidum TaxID=119954 RepID=A0ACB9NY76_9MYRT|nr:hypothetical protein MLD38_026320 [Melastoma candidum]
MDRRCPRENVSRGSERKLAFDCVNSALVKVTGCCGSSWSLINRPYVESETGWIENFGLEMDCVGRDIELKLLGELVDEAVKEDLTGRL